MDVFLSVAGITGRRCFIFVEIEIAFVAALAGEAFVFVSQWVFGLTVVIEDDFFPMLVGMTGFALLAIVPFVCIVFLMARVAVGWSGTISLVAVTVFAPREDVSTSQTER